MEIERINENTVKFYISYIDIEDRGFKREEIWYNRERSEQLFWQMMEEVNFKEDFTVEGPLWIQVQALEKGLEVVVTKAQVSKNGDQFVLPNQSDHSKTPQTDEQLEGLLNNKFGKNKKEKSKDYAENNDTAMIFNFKDFEDVIQLSHYIKIDTEEVINTLYSYEGRYYLYVEFKQASNDEGNQEILISQIYEFARNSETTFHLLDEYGTKIFEEDTFSQVRSYFSA